MSIVTFTRLNDVSNQFLGLEREDPTITKLFRDIVMDSSFSWKKLQEILPIQAHEIVHRWMVETSYEPPTYITREYHSMYGNAENYDERQERYKRYTKFVIQESVEEMHQIPERGDFNDFFVHWLDRLALKRHQFAQESGTSDAELFRVPNKIISH